MRYGIRCGAPAAPDVCLAWWCNDLFTALFGLLTRELLAVPLVIVDGIVDGSIRKSSLANLIKIRILKGGEYSEVESRKSDQNPHLEGGRVFGSRVSQI